MTETFQVPNLVRGLEIIEFLVTQESAQTITDISNALELPKNSVMRVINALEHYGYVDRDGESKRYRLTRKLFSMAYRIPREKTLIEHCLAPMKAVRDHYRETVVLSVLEGGNGIVLEQVQGLHPFRFVCEPGTPQKLHCSASTKAILALLPEAECDALLEGYQFKRFTSHTITSFKAFKRELKNVRELGFAVDRSEEVEGVHCVATAICDHRGAPVAAITLTGPSSRIGDDESIDEIGMFIREQGEFASKNLGHQQADAEAI